MAGHGGQQPGHLLRKTGHDAGLRDWMRDEHGVSGYADDPFDRRVRLTSVDQVDGELLDILAKALDQITWNAYDGGWSPFRGKVTTGRR